MKSIIKKLMNKIKKVFSKGQGVKLPIEEYVKANIEDLKEKNAFEILNLKIKNNSKDLFELSNFKDHSIKLWEISEQVSRPLLLMIMGEFKTGKSTFINAILEEEVLKSDVTPATAVVSMISYGEERKVLAHFKDGTIKEYSFEELKDITAEGDDSKKDLRSNIKYVELFIPKEILKKITIIDTPGLNVDNQLHIQATKEFMNEADMVFWVFSYGKAASRTEIAAISELSKRLKPIAIINRIDEIDEEEESLEEVIGEIKKKLKKHVEDVIGISAFLAKKGILENDKSALSESGWENFNDKLEKEILQKSEVLKIESILDKLREYLENLMNFYKESKNEVSKMESKFNNAIQYKEDLLDDIENLKNFLDESISLRKNKMKITTDIDYVRNCFERNIKSELEKIDSPLIYLLNKIELLDSIKGTQRVIENIQSYKLTYENILEEINKINIRVSQLEKIDKELNDEYDKLNSEINQYNRSGIFGGAPLLDWNGKKKNLEKWRVDYNSRVETLKSKYRVCEEDRIDQFSRIIRMNLEIYDYLNKIEKIIKESIKQSEEEVKNFDKTFEDEKKKYEILKNDIEEVCKINERLEEILKENTK